MGKRLGDTKMSKNILRTLMDPRQLDTWSASDLRALLEHQLAAPLTAELDQLAKIARRSREEVKAELDRCGCQTFGDLIMGRSPSGTILKMLKDYAKESLSQEGGLPRDVARVLYLAAILRGRRAGFEDMTSLDNANIERETRLCLTFGWVPNSVRDLLSKGILKT